MRVFHAKRRYPRVSPWDLKTRIESKFSSTNCQMDALIVNYRFKFEPLARQRPALVCDQIGNRRSRAGTLRGGRKSSLRGTAIRNVAPGLSDFTCESEGVTEIEREVGG